MKISFLIPSKEGGEGFDRLFSCIKDNIKHAQSSGYQFSYEIKLLINGNTKKPLEYIKELDRPENLEVLITKKIGKVSTINEALENLNSDYILILDDDISFEENLLKLAFDEITRGETKIVSFQTKALPYKNNSFIRKFIYDIINIRSLKKLYKGIDPFLVGRFILIKKDLFKVPDNIINEDLYLSLIYRDQYVIRPEEVYYVGESKILRHIKRVLRLETGREQVKEIFGSIYNDNAKKNQRIIDASKVEQLETYYELCYLGYNILRFFTNSVISKFFKHKTNYW